jgi:RecA/RadA recombinase
MKDDQFLNILKNVDPDFDESEIATTKFLDTGSYILNGLMTGSIYNGGFADNRVTQLAGEEAVGKSYFAQSAAKAFMGTHKKAGVICFDTEFALDKEALANRGIDASRFYLQQPESLQDFRTKALNILEQYGEIAEGKRFPLMMILDSLGNLPSQKEIEDSLSGSDTRDMTKAQLVKSIFRTLTMKLGRVSVPLIVTNHTYSSMDQYKPSQISGGSGSKYAASTILVITKSKDRDKEKNVVGALLNVTTRKSRYSRENQTVSVRLSFDRGLDRYYGLYDLAVKHDIFVKKPKGVLLPDGSTAYENGINEEPEKYFTKEILDRLDQAAKIEFGFGDSQKPETVEVDEEA